MRIPIIIEIPPESIEAIRAAVIGPPRPSAVEIAPAQAEADTDATFNAPSRLPVVEFPDHWRFVEEREGETYTWPEPGGPDEYARFAVYEGVTSEGTIRAAIGECERVAVRGKDRKYMITFLMTPAGAKRPIAEFLETDDYEETRELIAIIKGKQSSPKMYDPHDPLPPEYDRFRLATYRDLIAFSGSYNKLAIVAKEDDIDAMLGHTLIQAQTRHGLGAT